MPDIASDPEGFLLELSACRCKQKQVSSEDYLCFSVHPAASSHCAHCSAGVDKLHIPGKYQIIINTTTFVMIIV